MEEQYITPLWWGVPIAAAGVPLALWVVRLLAGRHRDRKTQEIIEASNLEGPVPDLHPDAEIPEVIRRRGRARLRGRF
ncbi:MAG: hypothetical protein QME96_04015 [Myxococcota bacterium]|nr:hypothetical protein [Myxococcota bacterium]